MGTARESMGGAGPIYHSGTSPSPVGHYYAVQAAGSGCTFNEVLGPTTSFTGATLAAGNRLLFGEIDVTRVTLSAGAVYLYQR